MRQPTKAELVGDNASLRRENNATNLALRFSVLGDLEWFKDSLDFYGETIVYKIGLTSYQSDVLVIYIRSDAQGQEVRAYWLSDLEQGARASVAAMDSEEGHKLLLMCSQVRQRFANRIKNQVTDQRSF